MASSGDGGGVEGSSRDRVAGSDRDGSGNAFENLCGPVPAAAARDAGTPFEPLGARRYRIEITVDEKTHDKLRSLQDLLARSASGTDPAVIVSRALDVLLTETLKRKAGCTKRPKAAATDGRASNEGCVSSAKRVSNEARAASDGRAANDGRVTKDRQATNAGRRARSIPAAVRRAVWRRDCGRCRYVDPGDVAATGRGTWTSTMWFRSRWAGATPWTTSNCAVRHTTSTRPTSTSGAPSWTPGVALRAQPAYSPRNAARLRAQAEHSAGNVARPLPGHRPIHDSMGRFGLAGLVVVAWSPRIHRLAG
jgi:hypothetical protein